MINGSLLYGSPIVSERKGKGLDLSAMNLKNVSKIITDRQGSVLLNQTKETETGNRKFRAIPKGIYPGYQSYRFT